MSGSGAAPGPEAGRGTGPSGPDSAPSDLERVRELSERHLFGTYAPAPVAFARGEGTRLWDLEGRTYLDFVAGIAVSSLGHAHPDLVQAIAGQAGRVLHVSNLYHIPEQAEAARLLAEASGLPKVFFCNSGAEAVEAAIKLARKWGRATKGSEAVEIVSAAGGFHGRTLGALAATGVERYRAPFEPLPPGFRSIPYEDLEAAEAAVGPRTCAVLVEPVQGETGVVPGTAEFLRGLQALCRRHGALFVLDEVQTGVGRTGAAFAFQRHGLEPDAVAAAKGLGGGVPIGALLAREEVAAQLVPGDHGSTFGGNPLACAAAAVVLRTVCREPFLARVRELGDRLRAGLERIGRKTGLVTEVRGAGLLIGADLTLSASAVVDAARERGLLVNAPRPRTLRLAPPLTVTEAEVDEALGILGEALESSAASHTELA